MGNVKTVLTVSAGVILAGVILWGMKKVPVIKEIPKIVSAGND